MLSFIIFKYGEEGIIDLLARKLPVLLKKFIEFAVEDYNYS